MSSSSLSSSSSSLLLLLLLLFNTGRSEVFSLKNQMFLPLSVKWTQWNSGRRAGALPVLQLVFLQCGLSSWVTCFFVNALAEAYVKSIFTTIHSGLWANRPPSLVLEVLFLLSPLPISTCSTEWCFTIHFTSGNLCLSGIQPAAPTLPHKDSSHPHPINLCETMGRGKFYFFLFFKLLSQVCQYLRLEQQVSIG